MSDTFIDTPAESDGSRLSLIAAIVLGIAATLTAISAYAASLQDGEALQGYTRSTSALNDANYFYSSGTQVLAVDQALFVDYASAAQEGNTDLADYLTTLMRPELLDAVTWWQDDAEATTPFDDVEANPYVITEFDDADALSVESEQAFDEGSAADDKGDKFELATVLLALTLFFGGIASLFRRRSVSVGLLGVSGVALVSGAAQLMVAFSA